MNESTSPIEPGENVEPATPAVQPDAEPEVAPAPEPEGEPAHGESTPGDGGA